MNNRSFSLSKKKRRRIKKLNYKRHPLWEKWRIWIYILLPLSWISLIGICLSFGFLFGETTRSDNPLAYLVLGFPVVFIVAIVMTFLLKSIKDRGSDASNRLNSTLFLQEKSIISAFILFTEDLNSRHVVEIPYEKIEKLIYNKHHERLMIIGKASLTIYENYDQGVVISNEFIGGMEIESKLPTQPGEKSINANMVIYDTFDDFETFIEMLSEKTGCEVQEIDCPEGITYVKRNPRNLYAQIK